MELTPYKPTFVRIDDYPRGTPGYDIAECRKNIAQVMDVFEMHEVPYVIGVSPELIGAEDVDLFNKKLSVGRVVMHGFDHMFSRWREYHSDIEGTRRSGGEFAKMSTLQCEVRYACGQHVLSQIAMYDREHFIAPFNCYTQNIINILNAYGVKFLHTCDTEYNEFNYGALNTFGMEWVISRWQKEYQFAFRLLDHDHRGHQITLHWMYDLRHDPNWITNYQHLCVKLKKEGF